MPPAEASSSGKINGLDAGLKGQHYPNNLVLHYRTVRSEK